MNIPQGTDTEGASTALSSAPMTIREWLETNEHLTNCWANSESYPESCCVLKLPDAVLDMQVKVAGA